MLMGLWMVNVVFALGHRLLNFKSSRVTYFVNASLFIYLVHHPLTLFFGAYRRWISYNTMAMPTTKTRPVKKPSAFEAICGVMYAPKNSVSGW